MKVKRLDGSSGNAGAGMLRKDKTHEGREVRPDPRNARGDSASPEWRRAS